jgi:hypothetical protein
VIGRAWLEILERVLRPARPCLQQCLGAEAAHLTSLKQRAGVTLRAMASCERRIDDARAEVLGADDGVVTRRMTELEREWRRLSSPDLDGGLTDLWAKVAPPSWVDRKRFRDAGQGAKLAALVALASDPEGVEAAERAVVALRTTLAPHGLSLGQRIVWRPLAQDRECFAPVLSARVRFAREACPRKIEARIMERAEEAAGELERAVLDRHPDRPLLAADLAAAFRLDFVWRAASLSESENPVAPLRALYRTGYVPGAMDSASVALEFAPIQPS